MQLLVNGIDLKLDDRCLSDYVKNHIIGTESDYTYKFKLLKTNKMNYEITEEQIKKLAKGNAKVKELFPEVFEIKIITGWFKTKTEDNESYLMYFEDGIIKYGFNGRGKWCVNNYGTKITTDEYLATDTEVLEALTNKAKKRGFKKGVCFNIVNGEREPIHIDKNERYGFDNYGNKLLMNNWCIFENGKWAEIIKTYTKKEAEKLLNAKII